MTAKVQPPEVAYYKSLGALDVIPKPFDPMTLAAQVRAVWEKRHGCAASTIGRSLGEARLQPRKYLD